jgi:pimeloyl-ACP methyl ester carboxylesterase
MNYDTHTINVGSIGFGYRMEGHGETWLLLLHGLNAHSGTWRKNIASLSGRYRVIAPSLPIHSGGVTKELVSEYADDVVELLKQLHVSKAAVVGNSIGGWIAMKLAAMNEGWVTRIVLEDTAGSASPEADRLESKGVPALIIWGQEDEVIPVSDGVSLVSRIAGSELKTIPAVGHVPHWEVPDIFNGMVIDFLRRTES